MRHANQDIRSIVTLLGYHKAQNLLSRNKVEGSTAFGKSGNLKNDSKPVQPPENVNERKLLSNYGRLSEVERLIIVAAHREDIIPELLF